MELRAKLAEILTANPEADPAPILAALKKERSPGVRASLLIALSRLDEARNNGAVVAGIREGQVGARPRGGRPRARAPCTSSKAWSR